jgi:hypothetical protein
MGNTTPKAQRPANEDAKPSARPVARFGYLNTTVSVFRNPVKTKGGRSVDAYNVSVSRSYMSNGKRVFTHVLGRNDLLPAGLGLLRAFEYIENAQNGNSDQ